MATTGSLESQRRDLLGDEADQKDERGKEDEDHCAVRDLAVMARFQSP